jgi:hypothetical protein
MDAIVKCEERRRSDASVGCSLLQDQDALRASGFYLAKTIAVTSFWTNRHLIP